MSDAAREKLKRGGVIAFWLAVWQGAAMLANRQLLLPVPTPLTTSSALWRLLGEGTFYAAAGSSLLRICAGFLLALVLGTACALAAGRWAWFQTLTAPLVQLIRAIPVASFTILLFLWIDRQQLPSSIVFLTVFPIVWANVAGGLGSRDAGLTEMAQVFGMPRRDILRHITLPAIRPHFSAAVATGLGFAWKSGVAAEIICRTGRSLGDLLWRSKSAVDYDEVFALTLVIVLCSVALQALAKLCWKGGTRHAVV